MLPIAAHALWRRRPAIARNYIGIAVVLGVICALNFGYFRKAYDAFAWHLGHHTMRTGYPGTDSRATALLTPLFGGSILAGRQFVEMDSELRDPPALVRAAKLGSMLIHPLIWLGIAVALGRLILRWRGRGDRELEDRDDPTHGSARRAIFGIALAGLGLLVLLYGRHAHAGGARSTSSARSCSTCSSPGSGSTSSPGSVSAGSRSACTGCRRVHHVWQRAKIHREGYGRAFPRPSLRNQAQVARELNRYADATVLTDVDIYKLHPQSIRTLRLLLPQPAGEARATSGRLVIRYRSGPAGRTAPSSCRTAAGEIPANAFEPLDVTPLPPDWHPAKW
jgi:hypothetical protein